MKSAGERIDSEEARDTMRVRIVALIAAVGAAVAAALAAVWSRRQDEADANRSRQPSRGTEARPAAQPRAVPKARAVDAAGAGTAAGAEDAADDLTTLKGIGAVSQERLSAIGVTTFAQLAAWTDKDIETYGAQIKVSAERIRREDWVGQARELVAGERPA